MQFTSIALAALVAAQATSGVKWEPLRGKPAQPAQPAPTQQQALPGAILAPSTPKAVILSTPGE